MARMSIPPETIFALMIGVLLYPVSTGSHHGSSQRHLQKRLEEVFRRFSPLVTSHATLNHGQNCVSPYEEKLRQQIVEELHVIVTSHATLGHIKDTIKKMEEFMSMNDKELCNYRLALVCDPESRKCVCGPSRVNVTFVWENGKCHYAEGSMCSHSSKIDCAKATRCISISTLEECSSGLCFCQREYYPTTSLPSSTTPDVIEDFEDSDDDEDDKSVSSKESVDRKSDDDEDDNSISSKESVDRKSDDDEDDNSISSKESDNRKSGEGLDHPISTKESFVGNNIGDEDDDDGDEEEEKIIVVKIDEVEEAASGTNQEKASIPDEGIPTDRWKSTTISTPVATSPVPTRRQELTSAIRRLEQEVESIKTLGFGDECFSLTEESNYAEYRRLVSDMDCVTGQNDEENLAEILSKLELILESGSMMCNWTLHLQCNGQSKKCECRMSSEDLDGFYLLFMAEAKRCVLVENSRCLSRDYLISRKSPFTEIPCASEAKCIAEETKAECKSKIENCFCRKPAILKTTEQPKQKKSRPRGGSKTSAANSLSHIVRHIRVNYQVIIFLCMMVFTMLMPRLVLIV